ncbi:MAG: glycosyltransferase [Candidatus Methanomethylophilaceae archaeon]|jgi:glycosyltransferase involved in cell wall biosynthesis
MRALIISFYQYPDGDAGSIRQHAYAKILQNLGYEVEIIGINRKILDQFNFGVYENVSYSLFPMNTASFFSKVIGLVHDYNNFVHNYLLKTHPIPDLIIVTRIPLIPFIHIKKYAKKNNIVLFHDCVEWFSRDQIFGHDHFDLGHFLPFILASIQIRHIIDKSISVVSISIYIHDYFINKTIPSLRIPVIMDKNKFDMEVGDKCRSIFSLSYAGSPGNGNKDYLIEIITAIRTLTRAEQNALNFTLLGVDISQLSKICHMSEDTLESLSCIHAIGRVPRSEVLNHLMATDFTILIRSSTARYAKAGFPTKVVESLMSSTPVILNMTSDLGMYLKDGYDCIEVEHEDPESIVRALRRALALTPEQKDQMKKNARKTAEENFDYRLYIEEFGKFIKNES